MEILRVLASTMPDPEIFLGKGERGGSDTGLAGGCVLAPWIAVQIAKARPAIARTGRRYFRIMKPPY
jgi:hypothetical protein